MNFSTNNFKENFFIYKWMLTMVLEQYLIMFKSFRSIFYVGQLHLTQKTQNIVKLFDTVPPQNMPHILNFGNQLIKPSFISTLLQSKKHSSLFELYLNFIQSEQQTPSDIAFQFLQQTLRKKVLKQLKTKQTSIKILKHKMISSKLLEQKEIRGVFIHRKYNLNQQSYQLKLKSQDNLIYEFKSIMSSEALALYQKVIRAYMNDKMKENYGEFKDFINQKLIVRYFYQVESQLELQMKSKKDILVVGRQAPTKHLLQIESYFNPISNIQQFYLTDVDYILKGSNYFRERCIF